MPKLLLINSVLNYTSTGKITELTGRAAVKEGWEVIAAYGRRQVDSHLKSYRIDSKLENYWHGFMSAIFDNQGLSSSFATRRLIRLIDEYKPDVVHMHNLHGYYINIKILFEYLNKTNINVVWSLHDCWPLAGHCTHFVRTNCDKWLTGCGHCPQKKFYPKTFLFDQSARNYRIKKNLVGSNPNLHVVGASSWICDMVKSSYMQNAVIHKIYNGIDTTIFHPTCGKIEGKIRVMGIANGWGVSKGLHDYFKLRTMLDPSRYEIMLVGLNDEHIAQVPEGIIAVKRTDTIEELMERLLDYYSSCDAVLNLSYADTFPTTNLEALACGTPVITYDTGGCPDAVDESTGIVVPQGDLVAIVDAIKKVESKGKGYYTEACRNRAVKEFDKETQYIKFVKLYEEIIK